MEAAAAWTIECPKSFESFYATDSIETHGDSGAFLAAYCVALLRPNGSTASSILTSSKPSPEYAWGTNVFTPPSEGWLPTGTGWSVRLTPVGGSAITVGIHEIINPWIDWPRASDHASNGHDVHYSAAHTKRAFCADAHGPRQAAMRPAPSR